MTGKKKTRLSALQKAASATALGLAAGLAGGTAMAQEAPSPPEGWEASPNVVPRDGLSPNQPPPAGILDSGVIGVGQMITDVPPPGGAVGLCTGTLINPRVVLFNAHCVNNRPGNAYGSAQGGVALSFGFNANNLPAAINWISNTWATNTSLNIYNANQVWWDPRSRAPTSCTAPTSCFLEADIALATLDTPAFSIPTWALLFSPMTESTHGVVVGYGATGSGSAGANLGIDFRRRAAENMIDALISFDDIDEVLFGVPPAPGGNPQTLYMVDFDDPLRLDIHDFDIFDGEALPNEGLTAGGDSGGPLIADQAFDIPVVVASLSGGLRFFGGAQPFSSYGTTSFYQPLYLFWDAIVANNSYRYVSALAGDGSWTDPTHWIQVMDPNYMVIRGGDLANDLPDTPAGGVTGDTTHYGEICFLDDCVDVRQESEAESSDGPGLVIPGGPGSTNFVPNNVDPNRLTGVRAEYYDVTLSAPGETWLSSAVTIDRFGMSNGHATLDVQNGGSLTILGDATIAAGLLNVDGVFNSGDLMLFQGILTGTGLVNPTFLTSVAGAIAPNGAEVGTLTIQGDVVLASASDLFMEVSGDGADLLLITADPLQGTTGLISLGGDLRLVKAAHGPAPRHGQVVTIILADGGVLDTFDRVFAQTGILRPDIIYLPNEVQLELRAGLFADVIEDSGHNLSFANALDQLREGSYNLLYDLYGELDVMDLSYLSTAFASLSPVSLFDAHGLMAMQDSGFALTLQNRMAVLSRDGGSGLGFSTMGAPGQLFAFGGDDGLAAAPELAFASALTQSTHVSDMPNGLSAFFSGGYSDARASSTTGRSADSVDDGLRTWQMAGGVEQTFGALTVGVGAGYSRGSAAQQGFGALAENEVAQSAVYGVYRFDNGMYVSGLVGAGATRVSTERRFATGLLDYHLEGRLDGDVYLASVESGWNLDITSAMTLTPNASVRHYVVRTGAYTESGGEAALAVEEQLYERSEARMGLRLAGDAPMFGWRLSPTLDASLVANLSGEEAGAWARFAAAPDVSFYLPGAVRDDYWGEVVGGLRLVRGDTSFALRMETSVGREEEYEDRYVARFARRF